MNRLQYLLNKLAEEASEVSQMSLKTAQFGLEECKPGQSLTNQQRMHAELNDLNAIIDLLNDEFDFNFYPLEWVKLAKRRKVAEFYEYSKNCGMIREDE